MFVVYAVYYSVIFMQFNEMIVFIITFCHKDMNLVEKWCFHFRLHSVILKLQ
jgi:hypothetical protein